MARIVHAVIVMAAVALSPRAAAAQGKPATGTQGQPATKPAAPQGQPAPAPAKPAQAPAPAPAPVKPAQAPAPVPAPVKPAPTAAPAAAAPPTAAATPPEKEAYTYRPEGRRDPFMNLVGGGGKGELPTRRAEGPAGITVAELTVRGVMQSRGALVAMIEGPDKKTYIVHQGDKLYDGTIRSISTQGLVVVQEVNDPLSLIKQREVRKMLRSLEDAKE